MFSLLFAELRVTVHWITMKTCRTPYENTRRTWGVRILPIDTVLTATFVMPCARLTFGVVTLNDVKRQNWDSLALLNAKTLKLLDALPLDPIFCQRWILEPPLRCFAASHSQCWILPHLILVIKLHSGKLQSLTSPPWTCCARHCTLIGEFAKFVR